MHNILEGTTHIILNAFHQLKHVVFKTNQRADRSYFLSCTDDELKIKQFA